MQTSLDWNYVKEFYKQTFGIQDWVIELYANLDILQLCASGASNESIVKFSDLDLEDVVEILMNTFNFPGWGEDLPINPYKLYLELCVTVPNESSRAKVFEDLICLTFLTKESLRSLDCTKVLQLCKTMKEIEERIEHEWI